MVNCKLQMLRLSCPSYLREGPRFNYKCFVRVVRITRVKDRKQYRTERSGVREVR